jgi:hypothetical protein
MKFFLIIIFSSFSVRLNGQSAITIKKLNQIIKKGICREETWSCEKKQIKYLEACDVMGDYYFKKKIFKKSLEYYTIAADLGIYTDGELQSDKTIRVRNKISLKAADFYIKGLGTKKDLQEAFGFVYRVPIFLSSKQKIYYSKLFFNTTDNIFFSTPLINDSVINIGINPFFIQDSLTIDLLFAKLSPILKNTTQKTEFQITISYGDLVMNIVNQGNLTRILSLLEEKLQAIPNTKIFADMNSENIGYKIHDFNFPQLSVVIKKSQP